MRETSEPIKPGTWVTPVYTNNPYYGQHWFVLSLHGKYMWVIGGRFAIPQTFIKDHWKRVPPDPEEACSHCGQPIQFSLSLGGND